MHCFSVPVTKLFPSPLLLRSVPLAFQKLIDLSILCFSLSFYMCKEGHALIFLQRNVSRCSSLNVGSGSATFLNESLT